MMPEWNEETRKRLRDFQLLGSMFVIGDTREAIEALSEDYVAAALEEIERLGKRVKTLEAALGTQREESHFACSMEHGTAFVDEPGHELGCAHARRAIRMELALSCP